MKRSGNRCEATLGVMPVRGLRPQRLVSQQPRNQLRVRRVPGLMRLDARQQRSTNQRQIPNQIKRLVTSELVGESQRPIRNIFVVDHNRVIERPAANQPHRLKPRKILRETERSRRRQLPAESVPVNTQLDSLRRNRRMPEIHVTMNAKVVRRVNPQQAIAIGKFERLQHLDVASLTAQLP